MKKLLLSIFFIAAASLTQAQDIKPTKEVTQRFINLILGKAVGEFYIEGTPIKIQSFSEAFTSFKFSIEDKEAGYLSVDEYSEIKWDELNSCVDFGGNKENKNLERVLLVFDSKVLYINKDEGMNARTKYVNQFTIEIPVDRTTSLIKAFERLSEIAKEENKDPFTN